MFKVEVIADSSGVWVGNGLRFESKEEAEQYSREDLISLLVWNDRNEAYTDTDSACEGMKPLTKPQAIDLIVEAISDTRRNT